MTSQAQSADRHFNAAKQLYAEQFGDALVTNTYLELAVLALSLIAAGLVYANVRTARMVQNFKPLVIRINEAGQADAVNYNNFACKPQEGAIKYLLSEFCRLDFRRNRYTIADSVSNRLL